MKQSVLFFFAELHKRERKLKQEMLDLKEEFSLKLVVRSKNQRKGKRRKENTKKKRRKKLKT